MISNQLQYILAIKKGKGKFIYKMSFILKNEQMRELIL